MKQMAFWLVLAALVSALGLWPTKAHDAAELLPAQVLVVDASRGIVTVRADCGGSGSGKNLDEALGDMRAHASGELFLQTADYVILSERAWYLLPQAVICGALRPAARIIRAEGELPQADTALTFLQAHPPELTLTGAYAALLRGEPVQAQTLRQSDGRLSLAG